MICLYQINNKTKMMLPSNFIHHTSASNCKTSPRIVYSEALSLHNEKNDQLSKFSSKGDSSPTRQISNLSDQMQTLEILDFCQRMPSLHKTTKTVANSKQYSKNYLIEGQNRCKTKIDKHNVKLDGQDAVRLSLTSFQEQLRALGPSRRAMTARSNDQVTCFKLQGVQYAGLNKKNKFQQPAGRKMKSALAHHTKNAIKMCKQSNLNEFNRILSKMHLEQNNQPDQYQQLALKTIPKRRRRIVQPMPTCRKVHSQSLSVRENATMSIINFTPASIIPQKVKCDQIFSRHFLNKGQTAIRSPNKKHYSLTENQLVKELMEIKREIANRNQIEQKHQQKQRFTKYTTSFIEEKLTMRKQLMRSYTFKKRASRAEQANCDDFEVDGWNSIEVDLTVP